jgi:hypothetical protein
LQKAASGGRQAAAAIPKFECVSIQHETSSSEHALLLEWTAEETEEQLQEKIFGHPKSASIIYFFGDQTPKRECFPLCWLRSSMWHPQLYACMRLL